MSKASEWFDLSNKLTFFDVKTGMCLASIEKDDRYPILVVHRKLSPETSINVARWILDVFREEGK